MRLRRLLLTALLTLLISLTFTPVARCKVELLSKPPEDLGKLTVGDILVLRFSANFSNSAGSIAAVKIIFDEDVWSYEGFSATVDDVDVSNQFEETVSAGEAMVLGATFQPANGLLVVEFRLRAEEPSDHQVIAWNYSFIAFPPPPSLPDYIVESGCGRASIVSRHGPEYGLLIGASIVVLVIIAGIIYWRVRRKT